MNTSWMNASDAEILEDIGKRVRLWRMSRNWTQQQLADHTGLNRSTIRDLEHGKPVSLYTFLPVLRALHLLDRLDQALPDQHKHPVLAVKQLERKRVRSKKQKEE